MQQQPTAALQRRLGAEQDCCSGHLNESVSIGHNLPSELCVHMFLYTRNSNEQACKINPFIPQYEDNGAGLVSATLHYRDVAYLMNHAL